MGSGTIFLHVLFCCYEHHFTFVLSTPSIKSEMRWIIMETYRLMVFPSENGRLISQRVLMKRNQDKDDGLSFGSKMWNSSLGGQTGSSKSPKRL